MTMREEGLKLKQWHFMKIQPAEEGLTLLLLLCLILLAAEISQHRCTS